MGRCIVSWEDKGKKITLEGDIPPCWLEVTITRSTKGDEG